MKLKQIPRNTVVHTPTEEEAKELLAILHENGYTWNMGDSIINYTNWNGVSSAYHIYPDENVITWNHCISNEAITLDEFKKRYCEMTEQLTEKAEETSVIQQKPQPKFKVGDKAIFPTINEPLTIHAILGNVAYSWWDDGSVRCAAILDVLKPYTEPETKQTEDMETKENRNLSQDVANCDKYEGKDPSLCELLKGHEGETFFSLAHGDVRLDHISPTIDSCIVIIKSNGYKERFYRNGRWLRDGIVMLFPSRELYEQYPLNAYTAWMKWQEEQKKPFICVHWGEVDCNGDEEDDYTGNFYFRTPTDRDKCIEEIKAIIEKYSKK